MDIQYVVKRDFLPADRHCPIRKLVQWGVWISSVCRSRGRGKVCWTRGRVDHLQFGWTPSTSWVHITSAFPRGLCELSSVFGERKLELCGRSIPVSFLKGLGLVGGWRSPAYLLPWWVEGPVSLPGWSWQSWLRPSLWSHAGWKRGVAVKKYIYEKTPWVNNS